MFDEKNHDRTDSFGTRMERLGEQMTPSPQLMRAAASGAPLPNGIRYSAGTHVKRFSKAILLYVACVAILIGAIMLLPRWFSEQSPVATQPGETTADNSAVDVISPEERYTEESGRYVSKNVRINGAMEQNYVECHRSNIVDFMTPGSVGCTIWNHSDSENNGHDSTVAVVKKIASESYFTAYDDNRTPLAYTVSTLRIIDLPDAEDNYLGFSEGDTVSVLEPYSFSPDAPDIIYRSHLCPFNPLHFGIMELDRLYLVNLTDADLFFGGCYEKDKDMSTEPDFAKNYYTVLANTYPIDEKIYSEWKADSNAAYESNCEVLQDLAIPVSYGSLIGKWGKAYVWAYETYIANTSESARDTVDHPEQYSEKQLAELKAAWAVIKPYSGMYTTINDYEIWDFFQLRDMIICQYTLKQSRPSGGSKVITLGGYEFYYSVYFSEVYVFANENRYTLKAAYDKGVLSQEDLGIVWKDHKDRHPTWYEAFYSTKLPLQDNRLQQMLYGKTSVNDLIDQSSLDLDYRFSPDDPENTGVGQLFDGIKSEEAYNSNGTGVLSGDCDNNFCFLFDMQEKVQISAYVITTGNDIHLHTDENPVAWWLYATNDAEAAAQMREAGADEGVLVSNGKWVDLDYVWDGKITAESFHSYGYMVDADKQGEYQYYCWLIEYVSGERVQVAELELYVD